MKHEKTTEVASILQGQDCPRKKGKVCDDICKDCPHFEGYFDTTSSKGIIANFTKDKSLAESVVGLYFYICRISKR